MNTETQEQWILIPDLETYAVSNFGRVKRAKRGNRTQIGHISTPFLSRHGYFRVVLSINNHQKKYFVHRLVMLAFVGVCPDGLEVNHIDGNKLNNRLDNLEYISRSENQKHAYKKGLTPRLFGDNARNTKITEADAIEIRNLYATGKYFQRELA